MAWWPFGAKKKEDEPGSPGAPSAPASPGAPDPMGFAPPAAPDPFAQSDGAAGRTMAAAPPPGAAPPAPDPFAQSDGAAGRTTYAAPPPPDVPADPFGAPTGDPFAGARGTADPFAQPPPAAADPFAEPAPGGDPFAGAAAGDPFGQPVAAPPPDDFAGDPFGAPVGFAGTADPYAVPTTDSGSSDLLSIKPKVPPQFLTMSVPAAADPDAPAAPPRGKPVPEGARPPSGRRPSPEPPSPPPPPSSAPGPVAEENDMNVANKTALSPDKRKLGLALLAGGPITQEKLQAELDRAGKSAGVLGRALLASGFPKEEELLAVLVSRIRIPKINVKTTKIPLETVRLVSGDVARRARVLPIEKIGDVLVVVSPEIGDATALAEVRRVTGCLISPIQCAAEGFDEVLDGYYQRLAESGLEAAPPEGAASPSDAPAAAAPVSGALAAFRDGGGDWDDAWASQFCTGGPVAAAEVLL